MFVNASWKRLTVVKAAAGIIPYASHTTTSQIQLLHGVFHHEKEIRMHPAFIALFLYLPAVNHLLLGFLKACFGFKISYKSYLKLNPMNILKLFSPSSTWTSLVTSTSGFVVQ
jgi:hypothetical protein